MSTINSNLQALLNAFATTNPNASQALTNAINASPALMDQYNNLAANGYLLGFVGYLDTTGLTAGSFNPGDSTYLVPLDAAGNVTLNMPDLVLTMGHEGQHATNSVISMPVVNQSMSAEETIFQNGVNALAILPGDNDYTSLLRDMQQANNVDESMGQLAGWNAYVSLMQTIYGSDLTLAQLLEGTADKEYFVIPGLAFNPDFTLSATPENLAIEGNAFFLGLSDNYGNLLYPNLYGAQNIDLICSATNGNNITINFAELHLDPLVIRTALSNLDQKNGNLFNGVSNVYDSSSGSMLTLDSTGLGTTLVVSTQRILANSTVLNSDTYDTQGVRTQSTITIIDSTGNWETTTDNLLDGTTIVTGNTVNPADHSSTYYENNSNGSSYSSTTNSAGVIQSEYRVTIGTNDITSYTWKEPDGTSGSAAYDNGNYIDVATDASGHSVTSYIYANGTTGQATNDVLSGSSSTYTLDASGHAVYDFAPGAGDSTPATHVEYFITPNSPSVPDFILDNNDGTHMSAVFDDSYMSSSLYNPDNSYACMMSEENGVGAVQDFTSSGAKLGYSVFTAATNDAPWYSPPTNQFSYPNNTPFVGPPAPDWTCGGDHCKKQAANDAMFEMGRVA